MTTQVNFSELKQNVAMEHILGHYGLLDGMKRVKENELVGLCPLLVRSASCGLSVAAGPAGCACSKLRNMAPIASGSPTASR